MLIDEVTITVIAGKGGDGSASLRRDGMTAKGGPDGGNGGNGGSVYFIGVTDLSALATFRYKKVLRAENGVNGGKQNMYGRNGQDLIIQVPIGTRITETRTRSFYEIIETKNPVLVARGGDGGRGNSEFRSSTNQTPRNAEQGRPGKSKELLLELRLIADVGLIGLPNAGKSSLLAQLTNATPKIGDYPFTTLEPNIGMMDNIALADIPGLIEGASTGKGLGITFLKHIEKTKILLHCIDITENDLLASYHTIHEELKKYNPGLLEKQEIILLTKTDLVDKETLEEKVKSLSKLKKTILTITIQDQESIKKIEKYITAQISKGLIQK